MPRTRRVRPPDPLPQVNEPPAPLPTALLTGPRVFARELAPTTLRAWRYLGVVVLSSVLSGVAYTLVIRHATVWAATTAGATVPGASSVIIDVLGGTFLGLLTAVLMWGLGFVGAGRAGRAAEVYGASFALLVPLWVLVIVWALLTPAAAWLPSAAAARAAGTELADLQIAGLRAAAGTQAGALLLLVTLLGTAAQCVLTFPAFATLTGKPVRAALGSVLPLLPALLVQFVGVAPLAVAALSRPPGS
ncbi:hypothetical protein HNQ07_000247 [Deinococcus metalli]|uniref:Yip1 domain-containing protein n=1 Tax=Deinococcus metalli TaxID=1141878 RepID=A0A7W8KBQ1_9DEIO|nr:hypothetical protein [Deinococcus metalli]MBB5374803.1 hypothetical protein [Deinococcus metalli]GHF33593.1 hypothetical protein GCM10017781_07940 [Deinococcus metalli]